MVIVNIRRQTIMTSLAIGIACFTVVFGYVGAQAAADSTQLTDTELSSIQTGCSSLQQTLKQLNYSDTVMRVNQGQFYEEISSKLMAPMNSRIVLNHYDAGALVPIAANYATKLNVFRSEYTTYANALDKARGTDCTKGPQHFYDNVVSARTKRKKLHKTAGELNAMLKDYSSHFIDFSKTLPAPDDGGNAK